MKFARLFLFLGGALLALNLLSIVFQGSWYPVAAGLGALLFIPGVVLKARWMFLGEEKKAPVWSRTADEIVESGRQGMFGPEDGQAYGEFLDELRMGRRFLPRPYKEDVFTRLRELAEKRRPDAVKDVMATIERELRPVQ